MESSKFGENQFHAVEELVTSESLLIIIKMFHILTARMRIRETSFDEMIDIVFDHSLLPVF